ncbi:MAG: glutathione S-transferase N-terminal domain-containing protein [Xanthomonadales bacterium]|nr:glutathione S-transferase N-terminal domain-containing protein [Xanthomonadales bacterium]
MKLFYGNGTCALGPIILAEWLDLPLEIERVNLKEPSEEFLAANPLGAVPALVLDDGTAMTQVDAIMGYFIDLSSGDLNPESGLDAGHDIMDRFELHRWQAFLTGDFHPPFGVWFNPARFTADRSEAALQAVKDAAEKRVRRVTEELEKQIGDGKHIALGRRTLLDAYAYAMLRWLRFFDKELSPWPNIARFVSAMEADDGVQKALERERSGA